MELGQHKLTLVVTGKPPIEFIYTPLRGSQRWQQNWITTTETTARGISVFTGVTARSPIYRWQIKTIIPYWNALRLDRLNYESQKALAGLDPLWSLTLTDLVYLVDSGSESEPGRSSANFDFDPSGSSLSQVSYNGETAKYLNFSVELILPSSFSLQLGDAVSESVEDQMLRPVEITFDLKEL